MKKIIAFALALAMLFCTFGVSAATENKSEPTARYMTLGELDGFALLYDTQNPLSSERYTRIIGDYYFTANSEQLGLSVFDGEENIALEKAYGTLIGDSEIKSAAKIINRLKENAVQPFENWTVSEIAPEYAAPATEPREKFLTGSDRTYYLFGWINGANYACEDDADNMGEYKFVNGVLKTSLAEDAYVAVKEEGNANWYMTDGWLGEETSSATLYSTSITGENSNKLFVPAGIDVVFTLVENGDGSLELSYAEDSAAQTDPHTDSGVEPSENQSTLPSSEIPAPTTAPGDLTETENTNTDPSETNRPIEPTSTVPSSSSTTKPTTPVIEPSESTALRTDPSEGSTTPTVSPTATPSAASYKLNIIAATLQAGKTITLKVTDKNGKKKSVTFSSSNKKVAKVTSKGKVIALKRGVARINIRVNKKTKLFCLVNVVTSPKLSKSSIKLKKGQTKTVKISGKASTVKNTYKNTKIAKITSARTAKKLKIRGLKKGATKLTVKVNGVKLKLKVRVV